LSHARDSAALSEERHTHTHTHEPMYDQWIVEGGVEMNVGHISSSRGVERSEHTHSPRAAGRHACLLVMILPQVHLRKPCYDFYFL
jgi:hypothetical protein